MQEGQSLFSAGSRVGTYLIMDKLGEGGMSEVFKAIEPTLERYVAVKIMHRTNLQSAEAMANFLEEARSVANLRHTNIVPLYSAGEEQGIPYLAMGYIEGSNLESWLLAGKKFQPEEAKWFMHQAVAALEYASRTNIIHLDVKPGNFMVDADNVVMLTDFGLARKVSEVASGARQDELQGTPAYASPEHIMQETPDLRTDIYCLGATLFHLMTGEFPYPGETTEEVCRAQVMAPFPQEILQRHNLPKGWISLIRRMMEKKKEDRFQSYAELQEALNHVDHFHFGKKTFELQDASEQRAEPRHEAPLETLFDTVPQEMASQGEHLFTLQEKFDGQEVFQTLDQRWPVLCLNEMADELREIQNHSSEDLLELMQALMQVPSFKETLEVLSNFMAQVSGTHPQTDAERIELVGLDRARNIALTSIALYRPWQSERPFNWHGLWQHQIYTGLLSEFIIDMLGLPTTGYEYLSGLVHDIGKLVLAELYPAKTMGVWMRAYELNQPLEVVEKDYFGVTHHQIGHEWLRRNKFYRILPCLAAYHDHPEKCYAGIKGSSSLSLLTSMIVDEGEVTRLAYALHSANQLAKILGLGYSGDPKLSTVPWLELPSTRELFRIRLKEEVTLEEFGRFFTETCQSLPDLPISTLAYASEGQQRRRQKKAREAKTKSATMPRPARG